MASKHVTDCDLMESQSNNSLGGLRKADLSVRNDHRLVDQKVDITTDCSHSAPIRDYDDVYHSRSALPNSDQVRLDEGRRRSPDDESSCCASQLSTSNLVFTDSRIDTQERGFRPSFPGRFCSCRSAAVVHLKGTSEKRHFPHSSHVSPTILSCVLVGTGTEAPDDS
ncbi:hypothetical protein CSKR_109148 [Clonorchis sinensis]|uniref:Uncharacterized protein n=1 Tax=Clonorchis sinensis TaxID=79923 RepID=A0A3R7CH64_CLOSI|nr:hypothetical protein CSKR_109148 [Clonorchis sinensis]